MHYKRCVPVAVVALFLCALPSQAATISGVTATTDMGGDAGSTVANIVDGSGLSALDFAATHDTAIPSNAWASTIGTITGLVTFDLGGTYSVGGMAVWNFNANATAGVNRVNVLASTDGATFSAIAGAPLNFAIGANFTPELAEIFAWGPVTASHIRFEILSNHGLSSQTGLSEVLFSSADAEVPEPASLTIFLLGLAGLGIAQRRRLG